MFLNQVCLLGELQWVDDNNNNFVGIKKIFIFSTTTCGWTFFIFVPKVLIQKPLILAFGAKPKNNNSFQILEPAICVFVNPISFYSVYCIVSKVYLCNIVYKRSTLCMQYIFRRRSTVPLNGNGRVEFPLLSVQLRGKASRYFSFLPLFCPRQTRRGTMNSIVDKKICKVTV